MGSIETLLSRFWSQAIVEAKGKKGLAVASSTAVLAVLIWKKLRRAQNLPPGSLGLPFIGETFQFVKEGTGFIQNRFAKYGGTFKTNILFKNTVILAPTEANVKFLYSQKELGWPDHWRTCVGETSLPMINDPLHKRIRTLNGRAFTDPMLDSYIPTIQALTKKHLDHWVSSALARGGSAQDFYLGIKKYTFDLAQTVMLGTGVAQDRLDHFMRLFDTVISGLMCILPINLPGLHWHKVMSSRKEICEEFQSLIDRRRTELQSGAKPSTMLDSMLTADDVNSDRELQDFCLAMMFAGHDTTLCTMQDVLYWLKQHPDVEAELRQEVCTTWDGISTLTRSHMESIPKCRAFVQEVMRVTPPVGGAMRKLKEDAVVDGFLVPRGWTVQLNIPSCCNKVPDPETFQISRHLDEKGGFIDKTLDAANYSVFGGGSRMCIGYKFARDELLIFILQLLKQYDWKVTSAQNIRFPFNYWRVHGVFTNLESSKSSGA